VHLDYGGNEERVPCEVLRRRLALPSCPGRIAWDAAGRSWIFAGIGAGHGRGLAVARAKALAEAGQDAAAILAEAYGGGTSPRPP
jgi:peptidoglycan hydrolase-like amidase